VAGHRAIWLQQVTDAEQKVRAVHDLTRDRDQAEARIPHLPEIYLQHCHRQLSKYFAEADLSLLEQWLRDDSAGTHPDRGILMALRRAAGAAAKVTFVRELLDDGVRPALRGFRERKRKYARKATKYERGKYHGARFSDRDLDLSFRLKQQKYTERPDKLRKLVRRITEYDQYGRFDLANNDDQLWFTEMTRKTPPSMLPRTRHYYDKRGAVQVQYDELVEELRHEAIAQAAAAMAEADDLGT
jgi:hypothetical protein